jgi:hypothetical protein
MSQSNIQNGREPGANLAGCFPFEVHPSATGEATNLKPSGKAEANIRLFFDNKWLGQLMGLPYKWLVLGNASNQLKTACKFGTQQTMKEGENL